MAVQTSHVLLIFIFTFFLTSFLFSHIFIANVDGDQKTLMTGKFRFLLGLKSFKPKNENPACFSLSAASAPATAPIAAPASHSPVKHVHGHTPPPSQHHRLPLVQDRRIERKDQNKGRQTLSAILASVGVTSIFCFVGLFFACWKLKKQKRRRRRYVSVFRGEAGSRGVSKFMSSQNSMYKVTSDPFYLDSLESALGQEKCCLDINCCTEDDAYSKSNKLTNSGHESMSCSSFGEITSVREIPVSNQNEFNSFDSSSGEKLVVEQVEKLLPEEAHLSGDESFYSFYDSPSSHFTNTSACTLGESDEVKEIQCYMADQPNPILSTPPRPPPPPPPPPPRRLATVSSPLSSTSGMKMKCQSSIQMQLSPCSPLTCSNIPLPPPSQLTEAMPLGKDGCPLAKLKPLHWDKVRAASNRLTVWDKLRSSSFEFDEEMIESLFGYNLQNPIKNDEPNTKSPSPSKHILDPKRLQNITILSKALNVTDEQVCGALIRGDGLSLQDLEALSKMVPTREEEAKLANYKGDLNKLGSAEKLVKGMLTIPCAFSRIEAMLFRETFEDEVLHLRKSFSMLEKACVELRSSRLFLKLLEAVLKTGNRMNIGTIRGGAMAFKLDALLKLSDVKGTDGKTTLLHFVVQEIIRSEGLRMSESILGKIHQRVSTEDKEESYRRMGLDIVSNLSTELCNAKKTATIDLDVLVSSVRNLSDSIQKLRNLVERDMISEKKVSFVNSMRSFMISAVMKLKELQEDEKRVLLHVREVTEYFHGDVGKDESNPLRIFVIVRDFLSILDHVCKELRSSKASRIPHPLSPFS